MKNGTFSAGTDAEASGDVFGQVMTSRSPIGAKNEGIIPEARSSAGASRPENLVDVRGEGDQKGGVGDSVEQSSMRKAPWADPIEEGWDSTLPVNGGARTQGSSDAPVAQGQPGASRPVNPARFPSAMQELAKSDPELKVGDDDAEPPRTQLSSAPEVTASERAFPSVERRSPSSSGAGSDAQVTSQVSDSIIPSLVIDVTDTPSREPASFELKDSASGRSSPTDGAKAYAQKAALEGLNVVVEEAAVTARAAVAELPDVASADGSPTRSSESDLASSGGAKSEVSQAPSLDDIPCDRTLMSGKAFPDVAARPVALSSERLQSAESTSVSNQRAARVRHESLLSLDAGYAGDFFSSPPKASPSESSIPLSGKYFDSAPEEAVSASVRAARELRKSRVRVIVWGVMAISLGLVAFSIYSLVQRGALG